MIREVKTTNVLEEGQHEGIITAVEERITEQKYEYIDVHIKSKDTKTKTSFSDYLSNNSALGQLLIRFGHDLEEGGKIEIDKCLIGKKCVFSVINNSNKKDGKTYANILNETLRPVK